MNKIFNRFVIIGLILLYVMIVVLFTNWTDDSFDRLLQIIKEDPTANVPWWVAFVAVFFLFPALLLFNIFMAFV